VADHPITVCWQRDERAAPDGYSRDHRWELPGGTLIEASAAVEYQGSAAHLNPEQALIGALASCHMLSFLAIAARRGWVVQSYRDPAVGVLEKNEQGRTAVTRVVLRPAIAFAQRTPSREELAQLHASAHRGCFIASSVLTRVEIEPQEVGAAQAEDHMARLPAGGSGG
jgi:organic hydroperoxide reductase OsmC/OhrA